MDVKCRTRANANKVRYEWTIENFSFCEEETGEAIKSSKFSSQTKNNEELLWWIALYPRGIDRETRGFLLVLLIVEVTSNEMVRTEYAFSIINADGDETNKIKNRFTYSRYSSNGVCTTFNRDILFDKSQLLLPDDKLTMLCEVFVLTGSINISGEGSNAVQVPECTILDDLGRLLQDPQLSDVVLSAGKKEYRAHKAILAARSPVFGAMFQHEMKENISNRIDIVDLHPGVLEEMLKFIYTGKVTKLEKMADKLLVAAHKYDLKRLKALCEKSLCAKLSVDNAANALLIADLHGAEVLKTQAIKFINKCVAEITKNTTWKRMIFSHPHLVALVFSASLQKRLRHERFNTKF